MVREFPARQGMVLYTSQSTGGSGKTKHKKARKIYLLKPVNITSFRTIFFCLPRTLTSSRVWQAPWVFMFPTCAVYQTTSFPMFAVRAHGQDANEKCPYSALDFWHPEQMKNEMVVNTPLNFRKFCQTRDASMFFFLVYDGIERYYLIPHPQTWIVLQCCIVVTGIKVLFARPAVATSSEPSMTVIPGYHRSTLLVFSYGSGCKSSSVSEWVRNK